MPDPPRKTQPRNREEQRPQGGAGRTCRGAEGLASVWLPSPSSYLVLSKGKHRARFWKGRKRHR